MPAVGLSAVCRKARRAVLYMVSMLPNLANLANLANLLNLFNLLNLLSCLPRLGQSLDLYLGMGCLNTAQAIMAAMADVMNAPAISSG